MPNGNVLVLEKTIDIMERLAVSESGLSLSQLTSRTGLPKSTIHRILNTLMQHHYIEQDPETRIYKLGYRVVEIASMYLNKIVLKTEAAPVMHQLASYFQAIAYLGVLESTEVVYLEKIEQFNSLRLYTNIGKREPVYCTALGKVLLSALPKDHYANIVNTIDFQKITPNTKTSAKALEDDVVFAKQNGFAIDNGEHTVGSSCVAVPIYDYTGQVIAALSVSGPSLIQIFRVEEILEKLQNASLEISKRMGYIPTRASQIN